LLFRPQLVPAGGRRRQGGFRAADGRKRFFGRAIIYYPGGEGDEPIIWNNVEDCVADARIMCRTYSRNPLVLVQQRSGKFILIEDSTTNTGCGVIKGGISPGMWSIGVCYRKRQTLPIIPVRVYIPRPNKREKPGQKHEDGLGVVVRHFKKFYSTSKRSPKK
jgi:hypothetical protein